ncbi:MAG TPA: hypothetical protein VFP62_14100 [Burkholderiales bacterium]|jgi:outer membrane murein-binding lipoprotein Lpp|nr:hypothetical protein [Burkholderiales bacterium]
MSRALLGAAVVAALLVAGCGEPDQVVVYKQGKYQGKPDTRAWDNTPLAAEQRGGNWTKGDRTSWETQIKNRQLAQHEHKRIYNQ